MQESIEIVDVRIQIYMPCEEERAQCMWQRAVGLLVANCGQERLALTENVEVASMRLGGRQQSFS